MRLRMEPASDHKLQMVIGQVCGHKGQPIDERERTDETANRGRELVARPQSRGRDISIPTSGGPYELHILGMRPWRPAELRSR
jgi:hypothetical protein